MNTLNLKEWNNEVIMLSESQLSNLIDKHSQKGFFIISACRANNTDEQNQAKTNELKEKLKSLGLSYTIAYGGGFKEKEDKTPDTTKPEINETSFIVYNYNKKEKKPFTRDELFNIAIKLCKEYNQDDVMFKEPDGKSYWYDRNGKIDATFQKKFVANDPSQRYFTAFRRNISDDKNTPGKNGKMPKANSPRFSGIMEGLFFNPAPSTFIDKQRRELVENEVFFEDKIFDY